MNSKLVEHFSHTKHPLRLKEDNVIEKDAKCYLCDERVISSPAYTCTSDGDASDCQNFYLHKRCAELPTKINHQTHNQHLLNLRSRPHCTCDVCGGSVKFGYACEDCDFDLCVFCVFDQREVRDGHKVQRPTLEHFIHRKHPLILNEYVVVEEDDMCHVCDKPVIGSPTYTCNSDVIDCKNFYLHKRCAELPTTIYHENHNQHLLAFRPRPDCRCNVCGGRVKFGYTCEDCDFDLCVFCVFDERELRDGHEEQRPTLEHFSHPKHPLTLHEYAPLEEDDICHVCDKQVIGSPTYTCTTDDFDCENFYLHKSCAELPTLINHHSHNKHSLALLPRPDKQVCNVCGCDVKFAYACEDCDFDVCVSCTFGQKVLPHEGHQDHALKLQREAFFKCDACSEEAKDYSYVCTTCDFWIHRECALAPSLIPTPPYHHHPLILIYSIPEIHRYFSRLCAICETLVHRNYWLYYCHKCTYFVHVKCATFSNTMPSINEIEADDINNEPDLVQFPLHGEESLFDLIVAQCGKFQVDFQEERKNKISVSAIPNDPRIIEEHWSHKNHPLEQLQIASSENDNDNDNDDGKMLICDGCIQPITIFHPSYYTCIQCGFFLHSFCATKLPQVLPAGTSKFHPHHSLLLQKRDSFYSFVKCGACSCNTNGFYYQCETCDIKIDIRCAFLPTRIKHKSHKQHSLVQRPLNNSVCKVSKLRITGSVGYTCETCSNFQIDIVSAFYPSKMKHKFDLHDITLRQPPFFYEGVFYCEICEEQVNNQWWLYHCGESDHSFHHNCLQWYESIKLGGTVEISIKDQPHTFALVLKRTTRKSSPPYFCRYCQNGYKCDFFFECNGCGFLVCRKCVGKIFGFQQAITPLTLRSF